MIDSADRQAWDAIVVGSGFGGAMAAHTLVHAGWRVLMLERGDWVPRGPASWRPSHAGMVSPFYSTESCYRVQEGRRTSEAGGMFCVGGPSVFYGGASFRYREGDFTPDPAVHGASGARWPVSYADMEPSYSRAEQLLGVVGTTGDDPLEPPRSAPYPAAPAPLAPLSLRLGDAARRLGLHPSRVPVAIDQRGRCVSCNACDGFACAVGAKNDIATRVITPLLQAGLVLRPGTVVTRLVEWNGRIGAVEVIHHGSRQISRLRARHVILAAGALATPHLLLASGLETRSFAPDAVGRYLTRHCNRVVFGLFPTRPERGHRFVKQVAITDFYFGHQWTGTRKLGVLQQMAVPPLSVVAQHLPRWLVPAAGQVLSRSAALLGIAEDEPQQRNGVTIDRNERDAFGLPRLTVHHEYTARDRQAGDALERCARRILREAGALTCFSRTISTFSHALGTVRMGEDPMTAPLDATGRYRGLDNLYVMDGSALPTSGGVNPSLTIAANALRCAELLAAGTSRSYPQQETPRERLAWYRDAGMWPHRETA
jgi:choline dehydrogenase-like flavoprotein